MRLFLLLATCLLAAAFSIASPSAVNSVDFRRDVEPILRERCYACHGPDREQGGLRLDIPQRALFGGDSGQAAIVPGDPDGSELVRRIRTDDEIDRMPAGEEPLAAEEIEVLRAWIASGAERPAGQEEPSGARDHWAYSAPVRPALPTVQDTSWPRVALDRFVLARLEAEGMRPSEEADRTTLIRRLSLDLLGLPPSPEEIDEFVGDSGADAYERLVDRLLASPHFGERWARHWLDMARYADSNGYTFDTPRSIWPYRDWVVEAFNRDMPFDRFTLEQLAGDLLPDPSPDQLVATGFHRNTQVNEEAGVDEAEFRVEAIKDRVDTTATVWLGSTLACAQCHSHKYDPFTQADYYRFFAFFNNTQDRGARRPARDDEGLGPLLELPTAEEALVLGELDARIAELEQALTTPDEPPPGLLEWEDRLRQDFLDWSEVEVVAATTSSDSSEIELQADGSLQVLGRRPMEDTYTVRARTELPFVRAVRLDVLENPHHPEGGPGRSSDGNFVLSEFDLGSTTPTEEGLGPVNSLELGEALASYEQAAMASQRVAFRERPFPVAEVFDGDPKTGWAIGPKLGVPHSAVFLLSEPLPIEGNELLFRLEQSFGARLTFGRFRLRASADEHRPSKLLPPDVEAILVKPRAERGEDENKRLWKFYATTSPAMARMRKELRQLKAERPSPTTTLVMNERRERRETRLLVRGNYQELGQRVEAGVPAFLPQIETERPDRTDLARWLVSPQNPLTHRVTVNRLWQRLFGLGLVETENDFGTRGDRPSHPQLLDWLALEFIEGGLRFKPFLRQLVTSATYRQASRQRDEVRDKDPRNRLVARQNRLRNDAETIRDSALVASGLLNREIGGPPVFPPQPPGVFDFTQASKPWIESEGSDRFRRSLYTWIWRTSPYPFLSTFDAPQANSACTRRRNSNTPLQALTQANDPMIIEIAQGLAVRALAIEGVDDRERLTRAFRWCVGRRPTPSELELLGSYLLEEEEGFLAHPQACSLAAPDPLPDGLSPAQAAAWTSIARVLLNTDEFVTRE